jgi:hypothetical protein
VEANTILPIGESQIRDLSSIGLALAGSIGNTDARNGGSDGS